MEQVSESINEKSKSRGHTMRCTHCTFEIIKEIREQLVGGCVEVQDPEAGTCTAVLKRLHLFHHDERKLNVMKSQKEIYQLRIL